MTGIDNLSARPTLGITKYWIYVLKRLDITGATISTGSSGGLRPPDTQSLSWQDLTLSLKWFVANVSLCLRLHLTVALGGTS